MKNNYHMSRRETLTEDYNPLAETHHHHHNCIITFTYIVKLHTITYNKLKNPFAKNPEHHHHFGKSLITVNCIIRRGGESD